MKNIGIYKIMAEWLIDAKANPQQAHLAFVALQIQGISGAYKYIQNIKTKNSNPVLSCPSC